MTPASLDNLLRYRYPKDDPAKVMEKLIQEHGSLRAVSRATGIPLVTISRWGRRYKVTPPPPPVHARVTDPLSHEPGDGVVDKLTRLLHEEGTWGRVASRLGVTSKELQRFRYRVGLVPRSAFKKRCEGGRGLFNTYGGGYDQT